MNWHGGRFAPDSLNLTAVAYGARSEVALQWEERCRLAVMTAPRHPDDRRDKQHE